MKIRTKDWFEIHSFYTDLKKNYNWEISPIIELVSFINNSKYAQGMYGYTSHATLCIGQYPELDDNNALLEIKHIPSRNEISFSYKGEIVLNSLGINFFLKKIFAKNLRTLIVG